MKRVFLSYGFLALCSVLSLNGQERVIEEIDQKVWVSELLDLSTQNIHYTPSRSISYAEEALKIAEVLKEEKLKAWCMNAVGKAYCSRGDLYESLNYLNKSEEMAKKFGDEELSARNLASVGDVYEAAGMHVLAIGFYKNALASFHEKNNGQQIFSVNNKIAKVFLLGNELDSTTKYFDESLIYLKDESTTQKSNFIYNLGELEYIKGNYAKSDSLLDTSFRLATAQKDQRIICLSKQLKADIILISGYTDQALQLAKEAHEIALQAERNELKRTTSNTLANVYAANGNYQESWKYLISSNLYADSLENARIIGQLLVTKFKREQSEHGGFGLSNSDKQQKSIGKRVLFGGAILALVIFGILVFFLIKNRNKLKEQKYQVEYLRDINSKMLNTISDDIRTPTVALYTTLELLSDDLANIVLLKDVVPSLKQKAKASLVLMDSLMTWASVPRDGSGVEIVDVHIKRIIKELISNFQDQIDEKELIISDEIEDDEIVRTDSNLLKIILQNFLSNAIKFSHKGGAISIFSLLIYGKYKIIVKDEGVGMTTEQIDLLFSKNQIRTMGTEQEIGSGNGLRLCKDFANLIDSEIGVRSEPGIGSDFSIAIPSGPVESS